MLPLYHVKTYKYRQINNIEFTLSIVNIVTFLFLFSFFKSPKLQTFFSGSAHMKTFVPKCLECLGLDDRFGERRLARDLGLDYRWTRMGAMANLSQLSSKHQICYERFNLTFSPQ